VPAGAPTSLLAPEPPGEPALVSSATVAEQILSVLAARGVRHVFLNPGTDTAPFQEAASSLADRGLPCPRFIPCAHESVALSAAHGYWQVTREPQCVMVHVDVGTQNLGAMLHDAMRDRAGVVLIAGKAPYDVDGRAPGGRDTYIHWLQDVPDQAGIARGYVKWWQEIVRPDAAALTVARALQVAASSPAGPTYLMVAREVLMERPAPAPAHFRLPVPSGAAMAEDTLDQVVSLLAGARRPVLVTSRVGRQPEAVQPLTRLVELLGMQVIGQPEAVNLDWSHPCYLRADAPAATALAEADLVVILEADVPWIPKYSQPSPNATVVHIDPDPVKVTMPLWSFPADVAVQADGTTALRQLVRAIEQRAGTDPELAGRWAARRAIAGGDGRREEPRQAQGNPGAPTAADVAIALNEVLSEHDVVVEEAVTNAGAIARALERRQPGTFFRAGGPGLGFGVGGSVGIKLAVGAARQVVTVVGDGSFLFSVPVAGLTLSAEAGAPVVVVVLNNGCYRASQLPVFDLFPSGSSSRQGQAVGTFFQNPPDFALLARACHAHGEQVTDRGRLVEALQRGLTAAGRGQAAVVDVVLAP
jgi:acetolactate synthase-1/2/3 large subunit